MPMSLKMVAHMAAWLGLVLRQSSSSHKRVLLGISKWGDVPC
jgi:transposase